MNKTKNYRYKFYKKLDEILFILKRFSVSLGIASILFTVKIFFTERGDVYRKNACQTGGVL